MCIRDSHATGRQRRIRLDQGRRGRQLHRIAVGQERHIHLERATTGLRDNRLHNRGTG